MPVYCYVTKKGEVHDLVFPIGQAPVTVMVGKNMPARRSFAHENKSVPASSGWPMECYASGVHPSQAGELRKLFVDKGVPTEVTKNGDPIYLNAKHRKKALRARGFVDKASYF